MGSRASQRVGRLGLGSVELPAEAARVPCVWIERFNRVQGAGQHTTQQMRVGDLSAIESPMRRRTKKEAWAGLDRGGFQPNLIRSSLDQINSAASRPSPHPPPPVPRVETASAGNKNNHTGASGVKQEREAGQHAPKAIGYAAGYAPPPPNPTAAPAQLLTRWIARWHAPIRLIQTHTSPPIQPFPDRQGDRSMAPGTAANGSGKAGSPPPITGILLKGLKKGGCSSSTKGGGKAGPDHRATTGLVPKQFEVRAGGGGGGDRSIDRLCIREGQRMME